MGSVRYVCLHDIMYVVVQRRTALMFRGVEVESKLFETSVVCGEKPLYVQRC